MEKIEKKSLSLFSEETLNSIAMDQVRGGVILPTLNVRCQQKPEEEEEQEEPDVPVVSGPNIFMCNIPQNE